MGARALRDVSAGLVVGVITAALSISLGALVFAGDLDGLQGHGVTLALLGTAVGGLVVTLVASLPGAVAHGQNTPGAVLAVVVAGVVAGAGIDAAAEPARALATAVATMAVTTLAAGAVFLALGLFRLGALVRYLPYPVIGGFMAGTGWLLVVGGGRVVASDDAGLGLLGDPTAGPRLAAAVAGAAVLVALTRRFHHPLLLPGALVLSVGAFYGVVAASNVPLAQWRVDGHLLGPFAERAALPVIHPAALAVVPWAAVLGQAAAAATVVVVALMSGLLNATGMELGTDRRVDLDRELRAAGLANLAAGSLGGPITYQGLGATLLAHHVGHGTRWVGVGAIAVAVVVGSDDDRRSLFLVASGQVTVDLRHDRGRVRLETLRGGSVVGEHEVLGLPSPTIEVVADEPTTLYRLDRAALADLAADDPRLLAAVYHLLARRLAQRVRHLEALTDALQR